MFEIDKKIISVFTFGFFLIIVGITGKIFKWNQWMIILATGLVFETLAFLMFAWKKIKKK